jgi:hypothetical protein
VLKPEESFKTPRKCEQPDSDVLYSSAHPKRIRLTGPVAVNGVADAIRDLAKTFKADNMSTSSASTTNTIDTPIRRCMAVKTVSADPTLTQNERAKAIRLFRKDVAIADSYNDIEDIDLRTEYLRGEMDDSF